jgi:hypothetical protein
MSSVTVMLATCVSPTSSLRGALSLIDPFPL